MKIILEGYVLGKETMKSKANNFSTTLKTEDDLFCQGEPC